jgi:signal transduction histidine kinase
MDQGLNMVEVNIVFKILVIEDDSDILQNIVDTLTIEGYQARGAGDGVPGLEIAEVWLPDLIVCDIMMPVMNGYDVLMAMRNKPDTSKIPFIFLTAKTEWSDMRKGMLLGADDYLTKPFIPEELIEAIKIRLKKHDELASSYKTRIESLRQNIARSLPHELRTPLTGVIGYSELLLMDFDVMDKDRAKNMLETIYSSGLRLHRAIENCLMYAQLEITALDNERLSDLRQAKCEEVEHVIHVVANAKADQYKRGDDLKLTLKNATVRVSEPDFTKIVEELCDNAFKFSEEDSSVFIETQITENSFIFKITDFGRGIDSESLKEVGAYMQFERALYEQQGLGLGLVIVKRLVELYGGQFFIQSETDQGTEVAIALPIVK